jgi:probable addiction module antidote protein
MNTVFIGGSRRVSRLPAEATQRLNNVMEKGFTVLVGDANGADKAVQKHLADASYSRVMVFCSGNACRNNIGQWQTRHVNAPTGESGFHFYAAKDREMAREAEFGLMIWDGKSAGTILNVLRLVRAAKKAVLINAPEKQALTFKGIEDWQAFLSRCTADLRRDLEKRALAEEWLPAALPAQASLELAAPASDASHGKGPTNDDLIIEIDAALAVGDHQKFAELLGRVAKEKGMSQVAKETGLAREALYRALSADGNPELATVLKVATALGLRLSATKKMAG